VLREQVGQLRLLLVGHPRWQVDEVLAIGDVALEQVLLNLIMNAIEAMPEGGTVDVEARPAGTGMVTILVRDTGEGIPDEDQDRIFQSFVTTRHEEARRGAGLGLMVCKRLVEAAGGSINVTSVRGQGSTFHMELPGRCPPTLRRSA